MAAKKSPTRNPLTASKRPSAQLSTENAPMRCPFLREAQVKYCRASAFKKLIVQTPGQNMGDRCTSPDFVNCPAAHSLVDAHTGASQCPGLQEALTQYCAAASITKYIPYSEAVLSHCGTDSHRYCELYLAFAQPDQLHAPTSNAPAGDPSHEYLVEGIRVPGGLTYSANHMWMDIGSDGLVHIGIDAFLAAMIDSIERITFVTTQGTHRPTVVFTIHGVDLQMVFPHPLRLNASNLYLRSNPSTILSDPYTLGWLFEGSIGDHEPEKEIAALREGLVSGEAAAAWMNSEVTRMTQVVHALASSQPVAGSCAMADGGTAQPGFTKQLTREQLLHVFNEFFSPLAGLR
jgi:glycine cleavage system H lipoate-binding protein